MVTAAAAVIFTGSGVGASSVQTTPATITAIGPDGQAVTNQKAAVIITATAALIPVRTAVSGSDQRGAGGGGSRPAPPRRAGAQIMLRDLCAAVDRHS